MFANGGKIRWINTAGFEIIMSNGKHVLIDPFLSGSLDGIECYPMSIGEIESCEYLILSHTHSDHAADVKEIQEKFPGVNIFLGDLSADSICEEQNLDCKRIYRVRSGESYEFDDFRLEAFSGRHTESSRGYFRNAKEFLKSDGSFYRQQWFGNLEFMNYRITLCDGTKIFIWGGMTSPDQKYKFRDMGVNISLMHVSPKQNFEEFAELVNAIRTQIVIPHHYDFTEKLFEALPHFIDSMSEENKAAFVHDGKFDMKAYMLALGEAVKTRAPQTDLITLEHHKWYSFGFAVK